MARKKEKIDFNEDFNVSIGEASGMLRPGPPKVLRTDAPVEASAKDIASVADIVPAATQYTLHRESSGRGGRTVTIMTVKPPLCRRDLDTLSKAMRKGLGCGASVEEDKITLQGNIQERAEQWLKKHGAKKVVMGN